MKEWLEWEVCPHSAWVLLYNKADIGACEEIQGVFDSYEAAYEYAQAYDEEVEIVEWEVLRLKS